MFNEQPKYLVYCHFKVNSFPAIRLSFILRFFYPLSSRRSYMTVEKVLLLWKKSESNPPQSQKSERYTEKEKQWNLELLLSVNIDKMPQQ